MKIVKAGLGLHDLKPMVAWSTFSRIRLPRLIGNHMVLQRKAPLRIWGWADAGTKVTVSWRGKSYRGIAGADNQWGVILPEQSPGGPYVMVINAGVAVKIIRDIWVGDIWVCSGQSNINLPMSRVKERYADEIAHCANPAIREFRIPETYDFQGPREDVESGSWKCLNSENVLSFSAVGYFFAKGLFEKYRIPIGLINASLGGAPAEAFISEAGLRPFPGYLALANRFKDTTYLKQVIAENQRVNDTWYGQLQQGDRGLGNGGKPWFDPEYDASDWLTMRVPSFWEEAGVFRGNGVFWFRKEINVPASMAGQPARLFLGRIVDSDAVYLNGNLVGTTGYQYPPRIYEVPAHLLHAGMNTLVIRVINTSGHGGFIHDKPYYLEAGGTRIDLKGEWRCQIGVITAALPEETRPQWQPVGLFNGMIAPLLNTGIKGVIWYQGESNIEKAREYRCLFPTLITDWRRQWNQGDFPFLYVQLPNCLPEVDQPAESAWAELRDAQLRTLTLPNTGMAVTIDAGEWNDLHPLDKKTVGTRLALLAHQNAYGDREVVASGPLYHSMLIRDGRIEVTFSNIGGGLVIKGGGELKGFVVAGSDHKYVRAKARIEGGQVVVWHEQIVAPVALRYAWADNPADANLYNADGLPASPFTTEES